jgi:hypothetical protein
VVLHVLGNDGNEKLKNTQFHSLFLLSSLAFNFVQLCLLLYPQSKNKVFLIFCLNLVWRPRKIGKNKRDKDLMGLST